MRHIILTALLTLAVDYSWLQETENCRCVIFYLCNKTSGTIIDDGDGLLTERLGGCNCECKSTEVCCRYSESSTSLSNTCGVHNFNGVGSKTSGNEEAVKFGEFPWFVDILVTSGGLRCGGSLIHPSVVLTAAHCVTKKKTYIVRAGDWDISDPDENYKYQNLQVSTVKIHEEYNPAVYYNDIALLFLNGSFNLTDHIQTICLPPPNTQISSKISCYVMGRGKDRLGQIGNIPKKVSLPLVEKSDCQDALRKTNKLGKNWYLHRSMQCAGEKDKDTCMGDGGSPLVCPINGEEERYQQVGIVSWGIGCYQQNIPAVYSNVQVLRQWIDKQMTEKNLETNQYEYQRNV